MSGATIPLVYYNEHGDRIIIGEAAVKLIDGEMVADILMVDERFSDVLHPALEVSLSLPDSLQPMLPDSLEP